ncbi:hypothetical protein [Burkholderia sp. Bp9142]|uniref:hypothetical protein n=1 Tax=Burkholderia sp. Bp9142 TaxID=2184573 RepID=UPI000F5B647F|nr:hypothetical protein [Burkholderia sp. Bp9142]
MKHWLHQPICWSADSLLSVLLQRQEFVKKVVLYHVPSRGMWSGDSTRDDQHRTFFTYASLTLYDATFQPNPYSKPSQPSIQSASEPFG